MMVKLTSFSADLDPVVYQLCARIYNADEKELSYLSHVFPYLDRCGLSQITIEIWDQWSADPQAWKSVDYALWEFSRRTIRTVTVALRAVVGVPTWDVLPYRCMNTFYEEVLPQCVSHGLVDRCSLTEKCSLHDIRQCVPSYRVVELWY